MSGIWSMLFGNSKTVDSIVDGVKSAADKMFYTDEEKADASKEGWKLWIKYQEATAPQNVSRRMIAVVVVGIWGLLVIMHVALWPWFREYSEFIFNVLKDVVVPPFLLVMAFYFAKRMFQKKED